MTSSTVLAALALLAALVVVLVTVVAADPVGVSSGPVSASEYKVSGLKVFGAEDDMYAGIMPLKWEKNDLGGFFFWLAKKRNTDSQPQATRKLIIWLNGGPGCSSMVGMMWENGPFTLQFGDSERFRLIRNNHSWNEEADVLFVDQPLRTGFSLAAQGSAQVRKEHTVGEHFRLFLLSFLQVFDEYTGAELYLTGESYAGFYIPWIAEHIIHNQVYRSDSGQLWRDTSSDGINLVGAAIGNGEMDYVIQEQSYTEYAYSHGLIPLAAKQRFDRELQQCLAKVRRSGEKLSRGSFEQCNAMTKVLDAAGRPNEYDTSTFRQYDRILNAEGPFFAFFRDPFVQESLHLKSSNGVPGVNFIVEGQAEGATYTGPLQDWQVCNDNVDEAMLADHPISVVPTMQTLADFSLRRKDANSYPLRSPPTSVTPSLDGSFRLMIYSGAFDLNCNMLGTLHALEANRWRNRPWSHADRSLWMFAGDVAGEYFSMDNVFSFLIVRNSGHLLPMDIPLTALEMIRKFIGNESFADKVLPSEVSYWQSDDKPSVGMSDTEHTSSSMLPIGITTAVVIVGILALMWKKIRREKGGYSPIEGGIELGAEA